MPEATLVHCEDKKGGLCGLACILPPVGTKHASRLRLHLSHPHWLTCGPLHVHMRLASMQNLQRAGSRGKWGLALGAHNSWLGISTSLLPCLFPFYLVSLCISNHV